LFSAESGPARREYESFMEELVEKQAASLRLALGRTGVRTLYVDGGFSKNRLYISGLARKFPEMSVIPAEVGQAYGTGCGTFTS
jgi:predicted TIM-barrel fold metal-dependent hydrolase